MNSPENGVMRIGAWRVDPALDEISKDGETTKLEPRTMRLLVCLAEHAGQVVSVDQLLDQVWKGVIVTPNSVYHAVATLRRTLGDDTNEPTYIANVLRRGYRLVAPVSRSVEATAVQEGDAKAVPNDDGDEPTPEFLKRTVAVEPHRSSWKLSGQRLGRAIIVVLVLGIAYLLIDKLWLSKRLGTNAQKTSAAAVVSDKSIAVLSFVDMSEKKDQEYFADGMAEEVLDRLAKVPGIRAIGRTSSFQFKGKSEDLRTIGRTLGATYLVEGSVRRSGQQVRVTAQLVAAQNGSYLWSDTYDEDVGDVLKLEDQIATGLVRALQVTVGADDLQSATTINNPQAYDLYLRGRHAFDRGNKAALESALGYFQQSLELDPSFIRAIEWLAITQLIRASQNYVPPREGYEQTRASVERGLAISPKSGALHALMALIRGAYDWDWVAAEEEARRALALDPRDATVLLSTGEVYLILGRWEEAVRLCDASLAIDPLNMEAHWDLAVVRSRTGRFSEAEEEFRKALEISPTSAVLHSNLGWTLLYEGKLEEALAEMRQEPTDLRNWGSALVYQRMGRKAESDAALAVYAKKHADDDPYGIAELHAYGGEVDEAFAWLDRALSQRQAGLFLVKFNPDFNSLKGDPRYKAFLRNLNLPE
jgi:TolB-like protein/DNA-binding winged helix-turn-helix (wHTH) protein/Flp pilus assembly protein TadD